MSKPKPGLGKGIARTLAPVQATRSVARLHPPAPVPLWEATGRRSYSAAPIRSSVDTYPYPSSYLPPSLLFDRPRAGPSSARFEFAPPVTTLPVLRVPSPPHPAKTARPFETHTVLSPTGTSAPVPPPLAFGARPEEIEVTTAAPVPDPNNLNLYSSNLIFHLGAAGSPKDRPPTPPRRGGGDPPPPRQRSFPLPDVTPPASLTSTAVGEDSYFARVDGVCVADGVGGWSRSGKGPGDPGRWARLLTHFCEEEVARWWAGADEYLADSGDWKRAFARDKQPQRRPLDPVEIMQRGYEKCLACAAQEGIYGSSTCLLALLHHSTLLVANLGDCSLLVVRRGEVVFRTSEMQHAFNFPLQLGTHSRDEPMKDAKRYDIGVEKEDVVIVGSDGLMDNLFDEDILETLSEFAPPAQQSNLPPFSPQIVSEALCNRAREISETTTATTPFMMRAIEEGIDFVGGKRDDISVLVGVVGDRDSNLVLEAA